MLMGVVHTDNGTLSQKLRASLKRNLEPSCGPHGQWHVVSKTKGFPLRKGEPSCPSILLLCFLVIFQLKISKSAGCSCRLETTYLRAELWAKFGVAFSVRPKLEWVNVMGLAQV